MSLDERLDDLDLLRDWRSGDPRAGDRLLARHFGAVYRFFRSKAEPAAEALAQATFLACKDREVVDPTLAFKAVLFAAARERLIEHLGRVGERTIDAATTSLARLGLAESAASTDVHIALRGLPLDVQIAVELHHWERLSVADVAHVIGLGAGAVKGRLARVRKQLDARVLRGPTLLLDAESQRAWAAVRARMFDAPAKGGFGRYRILEPLEQIARARSVVADDGVVPSGQAAAPRTTVLSNRPSAVAE